MELPGRVEDFKIKDEPRVCKGRREIVLGFVGGGCLELKQGRFVQVKMFFVILNVSCYPQMFLVIQDVPRYPNVTSCYP